jgi:2-keto-4-pentenoate hydratase/2-oxohepta-3-ene-1,7-dioic acid hydratase in catechol pathway
MRIVTFRRNGIVQHGVRNGDSIAVHSDATSAVDLANNRGSIAAETVALAEVELLPPVPDPGKIVCIGLNYRAHAIEGGNPIPDYPAVFLRVTTSLAAPGAALIYPACSDRLDYEAELAVIIGKTATNVSKADALDHVAGYSCFNDGSVRDYQRKSTQWTMGKNFDGTGGFGPDLVTADELPSGASGLRLVSRLNGQVMQDSNTSDMIFDVATLIAIVSEGMTLEPGDVIATGTPAGVGYARTPPVFMRPGDVCEIEIEGIGVLINTIAERA